MSKAHKEALLRREAILRSRRLWILLHVGMQRGQGDAQSAIVGCVLAQRQASVEMNVVNRDK